MKPPPAGRFLPIDAMRGIASMSVLVFHLFRSPPQTDVLAAAFPGPVEIFSDYARSGVAVFFVISGFVIAYTTRDLGPRVRDGVRFALRRQVRLDPPYYVVMAIVLVLAVGERLVPGLESRTLTTGDVLLNMFYLQDIAGAPAVLAVAWTLCLEVQFYLVVVVLVIASGWISRGPGPTEHRIRFVTTIALLLGLVSLSLPFLGADGGPWFIGTWWMFCFGMAITWFMLGRLSGHVIAAICGIVGVWCVAVSLWSPVADPWGSHWFAYLTGLAILLLLITGKMSMQPPRWLLYLGTLSYSLYLVHLPVIDTVMAGAYKVTGDSTVGALAAYAVAAAVSLGAASVVHRLVERPAMAWSSRLRTARIGTVLHAFHR